MIKTMKNRPYKKSAAMGMPKAATTGKGKAKGAKKPVRTGAKAIKRQLVPGGKMPPGRKG